MKFVATVGSENRGGRKIEVELQPGGGGGGRVTIPSGVFDASVQPGEAPGHFSVWLGARVFEVSVCERFESKVELIINGERTQVEVDHEIDLLFGGDEQDPGPEACTVLSVMPGIVTRVLVKPDDPVAVGQPLLLLEAMKMENEVRAKTAGTVESVHVLAGDTVKSGVPLLTLVSEDGS